MEWHDEMARYEQTGKLDPVDRCLCPDCEGKRNAELERVSPEWVFANYRPGSADWSWLDEKHDLKTRDRVKTDKLRQLILAKGFSFSDESHPITLGNDGRVWDGHHRLILALELHPMYIFVKRIPE